MNSPGRLAKFFIFSTTTAALADNPWASLTCAEKLLLLSKMKQFFFGKKEDGKITDKGLFTDFQQGLSKEFKNVGSWIKDAFAEAGDDLGLDGSKKKQSLESCHQWM